MDAMANRPLLRLSHAPDVPNASALERAARRAGLRSLLRLRTHGRGEKAPGAFPRRTAPCVNEESTCAMSCPVCSDSGLLLARLCPLCDGFGLEGYRVWESSVTPTSKAKCLLHRILRTGRAEMTAAEREDLACLALSRRKRRAAKRKRGDFGAAPAGKKLQSFLKDLPAAEMRQKSKTKMGMTWQVKPDVSEQRSLDAPLSAPSVAEL